MINGAPYYYNYINAETSQVAPSTVHVRIAAYADILLSICFKGHERV